MKILDFDSYFRNSHNLCAINESFDLLENVEYTDYDLIYEFLNDKERGVKTVRFDLIPSAQYKNLVCRYMNAPYPQAARIPDSVVSKWLEMVAKNAVKIKYITDYAGHSSWFPSNTLEDIFGENEECNVDWNDYGETDAYLENIGFYDWCKLPDGSDAWSDYGLKPIFEILQEYEDDMESYEKLLLVNRVLNVVHARGDLASAFIEGGSSTCAMISGQEHDTMHTTF